MVRLVLQIHGELSQPDGPQKIVQMAQAAGLGGWLTYEDENWVLALEGELEACQDLAGLISVGLDSAGQIHHIKQLSLTALPNPHPTEFVYRTQ